MSLAIGLTAGGTALIEANKVTTTSADRAPMPVAATRFVQEAGYRRKATYLGLVRAGSDSLIGFEVAGLLQTLPATEGMRVAPGDVLAQLGTDTRRARLDEASATLERVIAERLQAEHRAERIAQLVEDGSVSEQDYDDAKLTAQAFNAAEDSARALQRSAQLSLDKSTLIAPYGAVVAERLAQIGAVVAPGTPVLRLVTAAGREAHIGVPIEVARRLEVGHSYPLTLTGITVDATLRAIRDHLDPATLTVGVVFDFSDQTIASVGESAELTDRRAGRGRGQLAADYGACSRHRRGLWDVLAIYADDEGNFRAQRESVEILYTQGDQAFVTGTVIPGEAVVASGLQRISPGDLVEPLFTAPGNNGEQNAYDCATAARQYPLPGAGDPDDRRGGLYQPQWHGTQRRPRDHAVLCLGTDPFLRRQPSPRRGDDHQTAGRRTARRARCQRR